MYEQEGISKRSKLALLMFLVAVLTTITIQNYPKHEHEETPLSSSDSEVIADNHSGGTITLPAVSEVPPGAQIKITALNGEWKIVNHPSDGKWTQ